MKIKLYRTAIHEAGHAVISEALDIMCHGVSIAPRAADGTAGRCASDDRHETPHKKAVLGYAGHAAVVYILNVGTMSEKSARLNGAGNDFKDAARDLNHDKRRIGYAKERALSPATPTIPSTRSYRMQRLFTLWR